jgi:cellulose synthase (UDP-forming)
VTPTTSSALSADLGRLTPQGLPSATVSPAPPPFLVPVLSRGQDGVLRLIVLGWFTSTVSFWIWWLGPLQGAWSPIRGVATACLAWLFLLSGYFLFFACRMTRPNPRVALPQLRVAMVVTKAPSEPWALVERTLRAMLEQDFPYPYDVWLADERPSGMTLNWCRRHGVQVSTRVGVDAYHQPTWPRRTKCKEGNLAYFYDQVGYVSYDVVAQLDADHVPTSSYLHEIVRPFADPAIGYVAAPSICDSNQDKSWTVRGRLHKEASLHGPLQAGSNGGWAPVCIGSHYAVRTRALKEVGGLGPDLAEDYTTTLWLQAGGWGGAFALRAEAHGEGPETFEDMLVQELQWARSLGTVLTRWAPGRLGKVPWRARFRLGFSLVYYPIQGVFTAIATVLPAFGVLTGHVWGGGPILGFYVHIWCCSIMLLLALGWLRHCGVLRPVRAKLWSFDVILFQLIRWPWATWGFFQGMWEGWRGPAKSFKVTPKGSNTSRPLAPVLVLPPLLLAVFPAAVLLVKAHPEPVLGLYLLTVLQVLSYLAVAGFVVLLHIRAGLRTDRADGGARLAPRTAAARRSGRRAPRARHGLAPLRQLQWKVSGAAATAVAVVSVLTVAALTWKLASLHLTLV